MTSIIAPKSAPLNWLEGFALTAILQGLPIFAAASLMVKLLGDSGGGSHLLTIAMASVFYSVFAVWAGSTFRRFGNGYEAEFFNASLPLSEKIARWRAKPATSVQLVASVLLLSLLVAIVG